MRILVINVSLRPPPARKWVPLGLAFIMSAMKRAGFGFDLLDLDAQPKTPEEVEKFLQTNRYDVVAMGCIVTGYKHIKWLSQTIRSFHPQTTIVVGNSVASSIPQILLTKTGSDIAVVGEGDETIVDILQCLQAKGDLGAVKGVYYKKEGQVVATPSRPVIKDVNSIQIPDWSPFDIEVYIESQSKWLNDPRPPIPPDQIRAFPVNTARGCPYTCTFCYQAFQHTKYRWRSPESIISEMRLYHEKYGINHFAFADELTFFSIEQTEKFADAMLESGLQVYWDADCRSGLFTKDEHVRIAEKMKRGGLMSLSFSLESANPDILKWMNKRIGPDAFLRQVDILRQANVASLTSIVIGYPTETEETIKATMECCIQSGIYPSAGYLLPQPGTEMYDYAVERGYITDQEEYLLAMGDRQDLRINMTTMVDGEMEIVTQRELARCSRELGLGLEQGKLLKTGFYRSPNKRESRDVKLAEVLAS
ncbi:MAG: B12-binding domain-containing radical SAM protein [Nitrospirae bacterium]|nr:B12-binding domain-containing radical SAM protein [Nitrospirota bacterium]